MRRVKGTGTMSPRTRDFIRKRRALERRIIKTLGRPRELTTDDRP